MGGDTRLSFLAPIGQMALTNYLMQTVIAITIFYGLGFGVGGNIGPSLFILIGIGTYIVQLLYSTWWLKHFNYGPFEWIWWMLTYGKWLPLVKSSKPALS